MRRVDLVSHPKEMKNFSRFSAGEREAGIGRGMTGKGKGEGPGENPGFTGNFGNFLDLGEEPPGSSRVGLNSWESKGILAAPNSKLQVCHQLLGKIPGFGWESWECWE